MKTIEDIGKRFAKTNEYQIIDDCKTCIFEIYSILLEMNVPNFRYDFPLSAYKKHFNQAITEKILHIKQKLTDDLRLEIQGQLMPIQSSGLDAQIALKLIHDFLAGSNFISERTIDYKVKVYLNELSNHPIYAIKKGLQSIIEQNDKDIGIANILSYVSQFTNHCRYILLNIDFIMGFCG